MGIGKEVRVDLDKYFKVLEATGIGEDLGTLKTMLEKYGISGETAFYQGPIEKDGAIFLYYDIEKGRQGILRFDESAGLYDVYRTAYTAQVPVQAARIFIAGLFGEEEVTGASDQYTKTVIESLNAADGCYLGEARSECNYGSISNTTTRELTKKGDQIKAKAKRLVELAREQDKFPLFGIEWSDLRDIYQLVPDNRPFDTSPPSEAKKYHIEAKNVFEKMIGNSSGYKTVGERAKDIECQYTETGGESYTRGTGKYQRDCRTATYIHVSCPDVEAKAEETESGGCY